jgi:tetratricopeptide (TPR) repeat protein
MKNILYIFLLFTQVFWAQDAFNKGNALYQKDKFQEAITEYETILNTKNHSAEVYFNLGNAYYKLNRVAPSIYNYEKALMLNPNYEEAKNNLKFAQNMTIDEIKPVERVGFGRTIEKFTSMHTYDDWAKITIGFSIVFLLFFIAYYFSSKTILKRIFFVGMFLIIIGLIVSVSSAISEKSRFDKDKPAIIFAESVAVKANPKESAKDSFILHEGTKVQVLETSNDWRKIQLADERIGWISIEALKEIK